MAFSNRGTNLPGILAGVDLSAAQHRFVSIDATGRAVLTAAAGRADGVNEGNPGLNESVTINGPGSVAKVEASAAIPNGSSVASAANGFARVAVANDHIVGVCVSPAGAINELCSVFMTFPGKQA